MSRAKDLVRAFIGWRLGQFHMHAPRPLRPIVAAPWGQTNGIRISLVTPVLNQAAYLGDAIESVLGQQYPGLEYVVMDGGSTDGSIDVARRYADRLNRVESGPDDGQADAINKGFAHCQGEVMGWLNADDLLLPDALHRVAAHFAAHPETDVVYGDRLVIDECGLQVGEWLLPRHSDSILSWVDFVPQETLFWRRSAWERAGGRLDCSFQFAMDWDLLVRLRDSGARFEHLSVPLGAFRVHKEQKTSNQMRTIGRAEMDRIRQRCLGHIPSEARMFIAVMPYVLRHVARTTLARLRPQRMPNGTRRSLRKHKSP